MNKLTFYHWVCLYNKTLNDNNSPQTQQYIMKCKVFSYRRKSTEENFLFKILEKNTGKNCFSLNRIQFKVQIFSIPISFCYYFRLVCIRIRYLFIPEYFGIDWCIFLSYDFQTVVNLLKDFGISEIPFW